MGSRPSSVCISICHTLTSPTHLRSKPSISIHQLLLNFTSTKPLHSLPHQSYHHHHPSQASFLIRSQAFTQVHNLQPQQRSLIHHHHRALHTTSSLARSDQALTEELKRLTQAGGRDDATTGPMLGPFMMPRGRSGEQALNSYERQAWSQVGWSERIRRLFRNGRNLVVVGVGGCLGTLVIYSILSELFAPSSPTNLMLSITHTLEDSEALKTILRTPYNFHTSQLASSKRSQVSNVNAHPHLAHTAELRFMIEGSSTRREESAVWWEYAWWKASAKRWIAPLITSEMKSSAPSETTTSHSEERGQSEHHPSLFSDLLGSLMPRTLSARHQGQSQRVTDRRGWLERRTPSLGTYEHGEVTAEIVKDVNGTWTYKSLYIDFPDAQHVQYRLDVLTDVRKAQSESSVGIQQPTRYRFWSRRINV